VCRLHLLRPNLCTCLCPAGATSICWGRTRSYWESWRTWTHGSGENMLLFMFNVKSSTFSNQPSSHRWCVSQSSARRSLLFSHYCFLTLFPAARLTRSRCFMWPRAKRTNTPYWPTQRAARRMKTLSRDSAGRYEHADVHASFSSFLSLSSFPAVSLSSRGLKPVAFHSFIVLFQWKAVKGDIVFIVSWRALCLRWTSRLTVASWEVSRGIAAQARPRLTTPPPPPRSSTTSPPACPTTRTTTSPRR